MAEMRIRPIDVLVSKYYPAMKELVESQVNGTPLDPATLEKLRRLQDKAVALGYSLEAETAAQIEADDTGND